jgi:hypothetical protein
MLKILIFLIFLYPILSKASWRENLTYQGELGILFRQFQPDAKTSNFDQQKTLEGSFKSTYEDGNTKMHLSAFARLDQDDHARNILNIDEAYLKQSFTGFSVSAGNHVFNWSVLEIFHPVDSINARNLDANAELIERLGQPSLILTKEFERSILQFIPLLKTVSPVIPSKKNRNGPQINLRQPLFVEEDFKYTDNPRLFEYVVHYVHNFNSFDLDLHYARKYDTNNPIIGSAYPSLAQLEATPYYLPVNQYGLAVQGTWETLIYKIEAIHFDFDQFQICLFINCHNHKVTKPDYTMLAYGLEYSKTYKNDQEGTYFAEYQNVLGTTIEEARVINPFQKDIALGYRHNFNDFKGHELITVVIYDLDGQSEQIYSLSHSFRMTESWKLKTDIRVVEAKKPKEVLALDNFSGLKPIRDSDNITFKLTKFF